MNRKKFLIFSCFYSFFCSGMVSMLIGSVLPDLLASRNLPVEQGGLLISCYSFGNLISGLIAGLIALKIGEKFSVILLILLTYAGIFFMGFEFNPTYLFLICAVIGFGRGGCISFDTRTINLITDGNTKIQSILHSIFALGAISAPIIFVFLRNIFYWQVALFAVVILGLISALLSWIGLKDFETEKFTSAPDPHAKQFKSGNYKFLSEPGFFTVCALMFCYLCCEYAINGWLVTYVQNKNMPSDFAQGMAALLWGVMLVGRLICAYISVYVSRKIILFVLSVMALIFFIVMLFASGNFYTALSVGILGLSMSGISPMIYASAAPFSNKYPLAMGFIFSAGCFGAMLMPYLVGFTASIYGFNGGMAMISGTFVLLVIFSFSNLFLLRKGE